VRLIVVSTQLVPHSVGAGAVHELTHAGEPPLVPHNPVGALQLRSHAPHVAIDPRSASQPVAASASQS